MGGSVALVGCGGATSMDPGSEVRPGDNAPSMPGGTSAGGSHGVCLKLTVNTATFVFTSPLSWDELAAGQVIACRNGDEECFAGTIPRAGGNYIQLAGPNTVNGPRLGTLDEWKTIEYAWSRVAPDSFQDGDRFSLTFAGANQQVLLFEQTATFETLEDCAGTYQCARYDLTSGSGGEGGTSGTSEAGASGTSEAGASVGGAEAGSGG